MAIFLFPASVEYHSGGEVPVQVQIAHNGVVLRSGHAWEVVHKGYSHLPSFLLTPTRRTASTRRSEGALWPPAAPREACPFPPLPRVSRGLLAALRVPLAPGYVG